MAKKKQATLKKAGSVKAAPKASIQTEMMGIPQKTWVGTLRRAKGAEARSGARGLLFIFGHRDRKLIKKTVGAELSRWQQQMLDASEADSVFFQAKSGPIWILQGAAEAESTKAKDAGSPCLEKSNYARFRDLAGAVVPQLATYAPDKLVIEMHGLSVDEERGVLVGLEIASYSYLVARGQSTKAKKKLPILLLKTASESLTPRQIQSCASLALSVNIARHYTNLPGGDLNPRTYAETIGALFKSSSSVDVTVWQGEKLRQERMGLLLAVGDAAAEGPRFVHIRYRPKSAAKGVRPFAIVGKGITFDSGGLDLKPSSGMRLMKKDMGGSAAAVAIVKWAELTELALPLDIYVSIAENAVSGGSFRPGDVVIARSGMAVEIHNTDAEGRLVLADALDVAVSQTGDDQPSAVINLATLTGAIKVGLGADIAGLFSNNDDLAKLLNDSSLAMGDLMWRMPLFQPYRSSLRSTFGDVANASDGGFGGAITAALFLEPFVKKTPWAHLDIYAWKDSAGGAWSEAGGSGQPVQALSDFLTKLAANNQADSRA
jgi:leucyl aminopeptidase